MTSFKRLIFSVISKSSAFIGNGNRKIQKSQKALSGFPDELSTVRVAKPKDCVNGNQCVRQKVFGLNLFLDRKKTQGHAAGAWAALAAEGEGRNLVRIYDKARTYFRENS
jgi:hypothetical protein